MSVNGSNIGVECDNFVGFIMQNWVGIYIELLCNRIQCIMHQIHVRNQLNFNIDPMVYHLFETSRRDESSTCMCNTLGIN